MVVALLKILMEVIIQAVDYQQKHILWNLVELYCYDFSEYLDTDVNDSGRFGYRYLDHYWTETGRHPFLILSQDKMIGFVLVNQHLQLSENVGGHCLAEFFILKKYRRQGLGKLAATAVFKQFPGKWEVSVILKNIPAVRFWRHTIAEYTNGSYQELEWTKESLSKIILSFEI